MVNEYILHGVSDVDLKNISSSANHGTYILSANKKINIFFEVCTTAGPVNVSHDTFSKKVYESSYHKIDIHASVIIQQPMMSRVWLWKR